MMARLFCSLGIVPATLVSLFEGRHAARPLLGSQTTPFWSEGTNRSSLFLKRLGNGLGPVGKMVQ